MPIPTTQHAQTFHAAVQAILEQQNVLHCPYSIVIVDGQDEATLNALLADDPTTAYAWVNHVEMDHQSETCAVVAMGRPMGAIVYFYSTIGNIEDVRYRVMPTAV